MKTIRLAAAAILTAAVCVGAMYIFYYNELYGLYRCSRYAPELAACFNNKPFQFSIDFHGMRFDGHTENITDRHLLFFGAWDKPVLYFMRDVMLASPEKEKVFVDVGANAGQYSMFMSRYSTAVHAFEPYEPVLRRFRSMIEANGIANIVLHPVGLGDAHVKKKFFKPPEKNTGTGSFVEGFITANSPHEELEIVRGDDALQQASVTAVTLIKIDIEGFEKPAIEGLRRVLDKFRPIVVFEMTLTLKNPVGFKERHELEAVFPENYDFLAFRTPYAVAAGTYELAPLPARFDSELGKQFEVVAYPLEKGHRLSAKPTPK